MKKPSSLASLLTLATGAASLPVTIDAAIVYTDLSSSPTTVGFGSGQLNSTIFDLPGTASLKFDAFAGSSSHRIIANDGLGYVRIGRQANSRSAIMAGTNVAFRTAGALNWTNAGSKIGAATFANIIRSVSSAILGPGAFSNKYLLFTFKNSLAGDQLQYGWVGMSEATITPGAYQNMSVTLTGWAYEDSGAVINAGAIPEPSTAGLAMGGALVLGAVGLRRRRKPNGGPSTTVSDLIA